MRNRTGCIYAEITNSGLYVRGQTIRKNRYVGELMVARKRFRFRSTSYANVKRWLDDMIEKYPTY